MLWTTVRWLVLMLGVSQALEAPLVANPTRPERAIMAWEGIASWYGPGFDGRQTANGEIYDMFAQTAAHLRLPLGSVVRLVNPKNGRRQLVRINDRGPYIEGREIDVSYRVACALGMRDQGLAKVRIELLEVPRRR